MDTGEANIWDQPQDKYNNKKNNAGKKEEPNEYSLLGLGFVHDSPTLESAVRRQQSGAGFFELYFGAMGRLKRFIFDATVVNFPFVPFR